MTMETAFPENKEAVRWYTLAAQQGNVDAQYNLDLIYQKGLGVTKMINRQFGLTISLLKIYLSLVYLS